MKKEVLGLIEEFVLNPVKNISIIFKGDTLYRNENWKRFIDKSIFVIFWEPRKYELLKILKKEVLKGKIDITDDAWELIYENYHGSSSFIFQEIEKFILYLGEGGKITVETLENLGDEGRADYNYIFRSVIKGNINGVLKDYSRFLKMKEYPMKLIYFLFERFKSILIIKSLIRGGFTFQEAVKELKVSRRSFYGIENIIQDLDDKFFIDGIKRILKADMLIRGGNKDFEIALEELLIDLSKLFYREKQVV